MSLLSIARLVVASACGALARHCSPISPLQCRAPWTKLQLSQPHVHLTHLDALRRAGHVLSRRLPSSAARKLAPTAGLAHSETQPLEHEPPSGSARTLRWFSVRPVGDRGGVHKDVRVKRLGTRIYGHTSYLVQVWDGSEWRPDRVLWGPAVIDFHLRSAQTLADAERAIHKHSAKMNQVNRATAVSLLARKAPNSYSWRNVEKLARASRSIAEVTEAAVRANKSFPPQRLQVREICSMLHAHARVLSQLRGSKLQDSRQGVTESALRLFALLERVSENELICTPPSALANGLWSAGKIGEPDVRAASERLFAALLQPQTLDGASALDLCTALWAMARIGIDPGADVAEVIVEECLHKDANAMVRRKLRLTAESLGYNSIVSALIDCPQTPGT